MAENATNPDLLDEEDQFTEETLSERFVDWVRTEFVWYAGSFAIHLLGLSTLLLLSSDKPSPGAVPVLEAQKQEEPKKEEKVEKFDIGQMEDTPPPELDPDPTLEPPAQPERKEENYDDSKIFEHRGGGMANGSKDVMSAGAGVIAFGPGPKLGGALGIGSGLGASAQMGNGGAGSGFGGRGSGHRRAMLASNGGTKNTERAVTAALLWLQRHQNYEDGGWSLQNYVKRCKDKTCTGAGKENADTGGTAMGLLPFLAAGQTHLIKGPYQQTVRGAITWLCRRQDAQTGALAKGSGREMYEHGLATIALSEAYGLSADPEVRAHAQKAVDYIVAAQNKNDFGWRYHPGDAGDTSVVGWQLMALKSAHMAGLSLYPTTMESVNKWLDLVAHNNGSEYSYTAGQGPTETMSGVGLLCRQYLGAKRDSPMLTGGAAFLMGHQPSESLKNIYYYYYATQVMHNMNDSNWETWNRKMRELLVQTQVHDVNSCANGSWDPAGDQWGSAGGRVMQTSLSALTLEIYYRYLPLFKSEAGDAGGPPPGGAGGDLPKPAGAKGA